MLLAKTVDTLFNVVFWIIILTILLSWIPNVDWEKPFIRFCRNFTDAILSPFRRIIPPIGGLDFSPILVLILLQLVQQAIVKLLIYLQI